MSEQSALTQQQRPVAKRVQRGFEYVLFNSRWLMAPFYVGLVVALAVMFLKFLRMLWEFILHAQGSKSTETILDVLALIDVTLVCNLILIVVFSGYENFVSKIDTGGSEDRPQWMGTLDFSGMKMKLIGSIVAISAISLLRAFMTLTEPDRAFDDGHLRWMVILHVTFLLSGVMFAGMDWIASLTAKNARAIEDHAP